MHAEPTLLHVCECYVGGVRTHLDLLLPALVQRGFRVLACLGVTRDERAAVHAARLLECGVEVEVWNAKRGFDRSGDRAARRRLEEKVREEEVAIVHSHGAKAGYLARTMSRPAAIVRVHTPHGFAHAKHREFGWLRRQLFERIERRLAKSTQRLVAVSAAEADLAEQLGYATAEVAQISNAIPSPTEDALTSQSVARQRLQLPSTGPMALVAGILMPEKGQDLILRALAEPAAAGWRVCFVGEGGERARYLALAMRLRLQGRAIFVGAVDDIGPWIDACDLALLPSFSEGLPYVALEVLSRARPLLSSGVGGLSELWAAADQERAAHAGLTLELKTRDSAAWAHAMQAWAGAAEERHHFGRRGVQIVGERYALRRHIDAHVDLYRQLAIERMQSKSAAR